MTAEFTGFHSEIKVGVHPQGYQYLDKIYGLVREENQEVKGTHLTLPESQHLVGLMRRFDRKAASLGIPTAPLLGYFIGPNGAVGKTTLHELAYRVGPDIKQIVKDPTIDNARVEHAIDRVLSLQSRVWEADFPIALDPVLANFCINEQGEIVYVDRMPPRQKLEDGSILVEYPAPPTDAHDVIYERYFTPKSAQVIYAQAARDLVSVRPHLIPRVKEMIGEKLGEGAYNQIDIRDTSHITNPTSKSADVLRIMAAEKTGNGLLSIPEMNHVYHLTHIQPGGIMPVQEGLQEAAGIISTTL